MRLTGAAGAHRTCSRPAILAGRRMMTTRELHRRVPRHPRTRGAVAGRGASRLIGSAASALRSVLGAEPPPGVLLGVTGSCWLPEAGIPTLPAFGCGSLAVAHRPNEWIPAADYPPPSTWPKPWSAPTPPPEPAHAIVPRRGSSPSANACASSRAPAARSRGLPFPAAFHDREGSGTARRTRSFAITGNRALTPVPAILNGPANRQRSTARSHFAGPLIICRYLRSTHHPGSRPAGKGRMAHVKRRARPAVLPSRR
jgi:hypothetical protein